MRIPAGDAVLSSAWLSGALGASPAWPHGPLQVVSATRIGREHGFSGRIHRVVAGTEGRGRLSFVVKQETSEAVERELLVRSECGELLRECVPDCFGGVSDGETGRGVLVLEDVAPADQGDVLQGCTEERAEAVVSVLARLHAASWQPGDDASSADLPRWPARPMDPDLWIDRLVRAAARFPLILTGDLTARIRHLPEQVSPVLERLRVGPAAWIHADAHLDNVLWRPDGTAVLLDWCNAAIGPPAADVARFLSEGVAAESRPALVSAYAREVGAGLGESSAAVALAVLPLLQSAVGWAGREDLASAGRPAAVCESWLRSVCLWAVSQDVGR